MITDIEYFVAWIRRVTFNIVDFRAYLLMENLNHSAIFIFFQIETRSQTLIHSHGTSASWEMFFLDKEAIKNTLKCRSYLHFLIIQHTWATVDIAVSGLCRDSRAMWIVRRVRIYALPYTLLCSLSTWFGTSGPTSPVSPGGYIETQQTLHQIISF